MSTDKTYDPATFPRASLRPQTIDRIPILVFPARNIADPMFEEGTHTRGCRCLWCCNSKHKRAEVWCHDNIVELDPTDFPVKTLEKDKPDTPEDESVNGCKEKAEGMCPERIDRCGHCQKLFSKHRSPEVQSRQLTCLDCRKKFLEDSGAYHDDILNYLDDILNCFETAPPDCKFIFPSKD